LHPSGRCDIPPRHSTIKVTSVRTTRTLRPDLPLCQEPSNYSSLHLSKLLNNTSGCLSVFGRLKDFFPKHKYGKTAATVRKICVPVWTLSLIRQVMHTKFNRPDVSLHGPDAQVSYMEIVCINSTVWTSTFIIRTLKALI
jgi:hypothetical protein